jgi:hypothetical protein
LSAIEIADLELLLFPCTMGEEKEAEDMWRSGVAVAVVGAVGCADYYDKAPPMPPPTPVAAANAEGPKRPPFILGKGVPQDVEDGAWSLTLHCDGGEGKSCTELGKLHASAEWGARDLAAAAKMYQKGCGLGDPRGCENLGDAYTHGHGVAIDREKGRELYERACQAHSGFSCGMLGSFYAVGYGVERQGKKAREYLQHACDEGDTGSCKLNSTILACNGGEADACAELEALKARFVAQDAPVATPAPK